MTRTVVQLVASHEEKLFGLHKELWRIVVRLVWKRGDRGTKAERISAVFGAVS